jgi:excinuclease ABC subunit B
MGRAARNVDGQVIMYADMVTDSMERAISETNRRRAIQVRHNAEQGIDPQTIRKKVSDILLSLNPESPVPKGRGRGERRGRSQRRTESEVSMMPREELTRLIQSLEEEMHEAAKELRFEYAGRLRDEIADLRRELKALV